MSVKECYKNYKNLKDEAKQMEKKLYEASRSMSKVVPCFGENNEKCFKWILGSLFCVCPKFEETSLGNLSRCQGCKCLPNRLQYEFCISERMRINKEKRQAKQDLLCAIKKSVTRCK